MGIRSIGADGTQFDPNGGDSSLAVLNVQHALNGLAGMKLVPEDGLFGMETSNAVLNFQREHQIPGTGQIDEQTIDAIHIALQKRPESAPPAAQQITGKQEIASKEDLSLTDVLMQSKLAESAGMIAPPLHMMSDAFGISIKRTLEQWSVSQPPLTKVQASLQTIMHQVPQNAVTAFGTALGTQLVSSSLPSLFQYEPLRVPLLQFSSQLEAVLLRNSVLNAPQLIAFAENTAAVVRSVLPVFTELKPSVLSGMQDVLRQIHLTHSTFLPDSGLVKLPGAGALRESGDILASLLTGAACRQAPASQILQSPAFIGALSTFALSAAVPFVGSAAGSASLVHATAFTGALVAGLTNHVPELLLRAGLDGNRIGELVEALPARWFLLSLTITAITLAVMLSVSKSAVQVNHREAAHNLRSVLQVGVEMEMASTHEAMAIVMKQTATTSEQMMTAVSYATEAARLMSAVSLGGILPSVDPKVAANLQGIVQRILSTVGKITEDSRRLLLLAEGI